jgi:DNA-binding MarR family transcriptional regulator
LTSRDSRSNVLLAEEADHIDRFLDRIAEVLPDLDLEVEGIVDRVGGITRRFKRMMEETLTAFDLTHGEYEVLAALRMAGGEFRSTPGKLAKRADLSSAAMTNRLDRLEQAGLVRRLPDRSDRRGVVVELTPQGRKVYNDAVEVQARKESLVAAALTVDEQKQLNVLLRRLMRALERREEEEPRA